MKEKRYRVWSMVMVKVVLLLVTCHFSLTTSFAAEKHKFTLVIDAGHGGKDAGAKGKKALEKNINLNVALAFGRYVEQNCPDVRVIYTRKTDVFIPLHQRANIANKNKADVFVSIHTNAIAGKGSPTGLETYTMGMRRSGEKLSAAMRENEVVLIENDYKQHYAGFDPRQPESYIIFEVINEANMVESVELAQMIQKNVCKTAGRPNKGVKQDAFLVLRETSMPACLVELGYVTTPSEEAYLTNSSNIDALGKGIYQAFVEYKKKHDKNPSAQQPAKEETPVQPQKVDEPAKPVKEEAPAPAKPVKEEAPVQQPMKEEVPTQKEEQPAKPVKEEAPAKPAKEEKPARPQPEKQEQVAESDDPVFKVQFMACKAKLKAGDKLFKGLKNVDSYQDGGNWKYTVGASTDYNEIARLRREVAKTFPEAFIVAFRKGERINAAEARQEFNKKHKK